MSADWKAVKAKADAVRKQYFGDKPLVNMFEIARKEGISIIYFTPTDETKNISGLLDKAKKEVYLNVTESAQRQNFTLAHELAHYFLDHKPDEYGVYKRNALYASKKPEREKEADYFAAELLMPKHLIEKVQQDYGLSDDDVPGLAKLFGVSPAAMKYRLQNLRNGRKET